MKLKITIVPAKILADGKHRIRIGMSHNGSTRYFLTRFIVDDAKCIRGGSVCGIPNANYINQQLMKQMQEIYAVYDKLENTDYLSCSQLLAIISEKIKGDRPISVIEMWEKYFEVKKPTLSTGTIGIWHHAEKWIKRYFKNDIQLRQLTPAVTSDFLAFLEKNNISITTRSIYYQPLRQMVNYAIRQNFVKYETHPYKGVSRPKAKVRDAAITLEELRRIRDAQFFGEKAELTAYTRDLFMLSFYLCGMNIADLYRLDFSKPTIKFLRKKTASRRSVSDATEFTIQPEARAILDRIWTKEGFVCKWVRPLNGLKNILNKHIKIIAEQCGIDGDFIFYSARKTFAQLANELMIKDSIIEYCLGDAVSNRQRVIGFYTTVNRRMADKAIRKILNAVASTKSLDELIDESF